LTVIKNENIIISDNVITNDNSLEGEFKMDSSLLSCILNPTRMRIIQAILKNKNMTVQQISKELPDVPQATLYRHLDKLVKANAITIVQENKIRGVLEKVYSVDANPYDIATKDLEKADKEEHLKLFYQFLMSLLGDFENYLKLDDIDMQRDGVSFRSSAVYLDDEEYSEFLEDLVKAFKKIIDKGPSPGRRLRKISTVIVPVVEEEK
jgi:DNA-binding transcriptional ArsR family regulator